MDEDPKEEYKEYTYIFRKKGKKFWIANIRDRNWQQQSTTTAAVNANHIASDQTDADSKKFAQQKIQEIVELRKSNFWCWRLTPNSFVVSLSHKEEPILKELTPLGYYQADHCEGLTFDEAKLVLKKLAQMHADYISYRYRPNDIVQNQREANRCYRVPDASKAIANAAITAAKTYLPNIEHLLSKIKNNINKFDAKMQNLLNRYNDIMVLNHGDVWLNNFIFKKENDILKDVVLLKSQLPRYGSIGLDLNFFLHTSLQLDVLKEQREELLRTYRKYLTEYLVPWYQPPTWVTVLREVRETEFYSFYVVMCELPLVCLEQDQCDNLIVNNFLDKAFVKKISYNFFKCSRVLGTLEYTLERLNALGVLDD